MSYYPKYCSSISVILILICRMRRICWVDCWSETPGTDWGLEIEMPVSWRNMLSSGKSQDIHHLALSPSFKTSNCKCNIIPTFSPSFLPSLHITSLLSSPFSSSIFSFEFSVRFSCYTFQCSHLFRTLSPSLSLSLDIYKGINISLSFSLSSSYTLTHSHTHTHAVT